jgi:predicted amidohydrolase YtcJ
VSETLLLRGGTVYSPADPFATAMVVSDGRIGWVGSEGAADAAAGPGVRTMDLDGALVTPAFVDAHAHLTDTGLALQGLDLGTCRSGTDVLEAVASAAASSTGPILGNGWDDSAWDDATLPTRAELDRAASGRVVYLSRVDAHSALVSSVLVRRVAEAANADGYTDDGVVTRRAHHLLRRASRDTLGDAERRDLQRTALAAAASQGIGQVHEMAAPHITGLRDLELLLQWTAQDPRVPEVVGYWGELDGIEAARAVGSRGCAGDLCLDGSLGSRTAALDTPYSDDPTTTGSLYIGLDEATAHVVACTKAGLQAGFHCIGERAVAVAVAAVAAAARECGLADVQRCRHRLEHVEMISDDLMAEMARVGMVASVQPAFDAAWGGESGMYASRLGALRSARLNPLASLARAGLTLAFGSDSPVTPFAPWEAVRAAAFHHTPEQRMSVRGAFAAHTRGGARAAGDDEGGVLVPGAPASYAIWQVETDLVVQAPDQRLAAWSTDPRSGVPGLPDLRAGRALPVCRRTVVRGVVVHSADGDTPDVDTPVRG